MSNWSLAPSDRIVIQLRDLRSFAQLTQDQAARLSGVGVKTISSYETGERIASLKVRELNALCIVYGVSLEEFFGGGLERQIAPRDRAESREVSA